MDIPKCREKGFSKEATDEQLKVFYQSFAFGWKNNTTDNDVKKQIASTDIHSPEKWRVNAQLFGNKGGLLRDKGRLLTKLLGLFLICHTSTNISCKKNLAVSEIMPIFARVTDNYN